jgi:hypothetical protein
MVHRPRKQQCRHHPVLLTWRMRPGVPSLRIARFVSEFERTLREACERGRFRVVHYSTASTATPRTWLLAVGMAEGWPDRPERGAGDPSRDALGSLVPWEAPKPWPDRLQ